MIGRGTRLCPNLFGPGRHKEHFLVFDFCQNFEFFGQNPKFTDGSVGEPLGKKLFKARVSLIAEIEKVGEKGEDLAELQASTVNRLYDEVAGMKMDNFIVRPQRRLVEKFQQKTAWEKLGLDEQAELTDHLAGLPSAYEDDDLAAKQFDHLVLQTQLAVLRTDKNLPNLQSRIMGIAAQLEELRNIPMVAAEMNLIHEVQTDEFWQDITLLMLETVRRRLRQLVKLIESKARNIVYTDFEDEIGAAIDVALPDIGVGTDRARFMMKMRHFLRSHEDHITIQKLRRNQQLTSQDLTELENMFLNEAVGDELDLDNIRKEGVLGLFIRSLVGLDREAAKQAFAEFTANKNLSANQIEFVNMVIDYLTDRGVMDPRVLYESPFTDIDDQGVSGVFTQAEVKNIVEVIRAVTQNAAAA